MLRTTQNLERRTSFFVTRTTSPGEFHAFLKNKEQYFLSIEVDYKNYTGNVTLIPWFIH